MSKYNVKKILKKIRYGSGDFKYQIVTSDQVVCDDISNEELAVELCEEMNRVCQTK